MNENAYEEKIFKIHSHGRKYFIELISTNAHCTRFKVFKECEYMFTLCTDENGNWGMEDDVTPLDTILINEIGKAIEAYSMHSGKPIRKGCWI